MNVGDDYNFMFMEDDENRNILSGSFGRYLQVEYHLSQGREILEDELDDNLIITNTHYKTNLLVFQPMMSTYSFQV